MHTPRADLKGCPEGSVVHMVELTTLHHQSLKSSCATLSQGLPKMQLGREEAVEEDGSLQGLLLRKVQVCPKSLLGSPELVSITGKAAVSP